MKGLIKLKEVDEPQQGTLLLPVKKYEVFIGEQDDYAIGEFIQGVDGYFAFWPDMEPILWPVCYGASLLGELATRLDELNKPWDEAVKIAAVAVASVQKN